MAYTDPELELYRGLMDQPEQYEDGFDFKTVIGAVFVGFVMMPGAIYLGLMVGRSLGPAAEWTTIILFTEIARRSFITLKKQEVYVLFYIAAALASTSGGLQLAGGVFAGKMWDQYFPRREDWASRTRYPRGWFPGRTRRLCSSAPSFTRTGSTLSR